MDLPGNPDPKMIERTMKRSSIILLLEDIKMMIYGDLLDGKFDGMDMHEVVKKALNEHQQSYLKFLEQMEQIKASKDKIPTGTKEN